jgi:hypothetical protein
MKGRWIGVLTSIVLLGVGASGVRAQDIANVERNIERAEQTLKNQPHLTQYCAQLKTGDFFFHAGRHRAGKPPVVSVAAWEARIKQEAAAGRMAQDRADNLVQAAKRLRNEQHNACNLDHWKAELARLRQPKVSGWTVAEFAWNGHGVIGGKGTLTEVDSRSWRFTGRLTPSWNGNLVVDVTCTGELDPGRKHHQPTLPDKPTGKMACRATWEEGNPRQRHEWRCEGPGTDRVIWSLGDFWFGIWPGNCRGQIVTPGKTENINFGLVRLSADFKWP